MSSHNADTRYMYRRADDVWCVQVAVPLDLRQSFGKARITVSLGTTNYDEARFARWPIVRKFNDTILDMYEAREKNRPDGHWRDRFFAKATGEGGQ